MKFSSIQNMMCEGGNVAVKFNGAEYRPHPVVVDTGNKQKFTTWFIRFLKTFNEFFQSSFDDEPGLWKNSSIDDGSIFSGSARLLFDPKVDLRPIGSKIGFGDIDIFVDRSSKGNIYQFLKRNAGTGFGDVKFIGFKQGEREYAEGQQQYNCIFEDSHGDRFQVDFVFVEMVDGKPSEFDVFARCSSIEDMTAGVKGVFHKYLLRALTRTLFTDSDACLATPATARRWNERGKKNREWQHSFTSDPANFRLSMHRDKFIDSIPTKTFSAQYGIRDKHVPLIGFDGMPLKFKGNTVHHEVKTSESTGDRDVKSIFRTLFGVEPSEENLKKFRSFTGMLDLIKSSDAAASGRIKPLFMSFLAILYGDGETEAQGISRDDPKIDRKAKKAAVDKFIEVFPDLAPIMDSDKVKGRIDSFYRSYPVS